jgi:DNA-binding LacI/PurR family transcriptional regulator
MTVVEKKSHNEQPKYRLLAQQLRRQITSGELASGDQLPTFAKMRSEHSVTSTTIERVYSLLEQEGLIVRQQGRGTFVAEQKRKSTGKIGVLLRTYSLTNPYEMDLISGLRHEARKSGTEILLLNEEENSVEAGKVDGVLMCCNVAEALAINLPEGLPHGLLLERSADFTSIVPDDFEGAKMITRHLLELGHTKIAFLFHDCSDSITPQRIAGYQAAHREYGVDVVTRHLRAFQKAGEDDYRDKGELAMKKWLADDWRELGCTALFAQNDVIAIGAISALQSAGLRVPQDVSVVGFDGTAISTLCTPRLTTVKVPLRDIGVRAVKVLLEQIHGGVKQPEKIVLPVQLKLGESTAPLSVIACQ